jgi:hypothetical protein
VDFQLPREPARVSGTRSGVPLGSWAVILIQSGHSLDVAQPGRRAIEVSSPFEEIGGRQSAHVGADGAGALAGAVVETRMVPLFQEQLDRTCRIGSAIYRRTKGFTPLIGYRIFRRDQRMAYPESISARLATNLSFSG